MISVTAATATSTLGPALEGITWAQLMPYMLVVVWCLLVALLLIVPTLRATIHASLVAVANINKGWFLYTESLKPQGKWFSHITGIALVDEHRNVVRIFYGTVDPTVLKDFTK